MKHCIPLSSIETITLELIEYDKRTGFSKFNITFDGVCSTSIKLTGDTISIINAEKNTILKKVKQLEKGNKDGI